MTELKGWCAVTAFVLACAGVASACSKHEPHDPMLPSTPSGQAAWIGVTPAGPNENAVPYAERALPGDGGDRDGGTSQRMPNPGPPQSPTTKIPSDAPPQDSPPMP